MRRPHFFAAHATVLLTSLILFAAVDAADPAPADEPKIDALVARLSDADWKARDRAAEELTALGEKAEPSLRKRLAEAKDPEERSRIDGLLAAIERWRQEGPALVTMKHTGAKPKEVFEDLAKQAGVAFAAGTENLFDGASQQAVAVNLERVPCGRRCSM